MPRLARTSAMLLAACALGAGTLADAQVDGLPQPIQHRDRHGCWADSAPDAAGTLTAGLNLRGGYWMRAQGPAWGFTPGRDYRIRVRAANPFDRQPLPYAEEVSITARGYAAPGGAGLQLSTYGDLGKVSWQNALALYRDDAPEPFAVLVNPYAIAGYLLVRCLGEVARDDRGSGKPAITAPTPRTPLARILTDDDYPPAALRARQQGRVGFRLVVSAHGIVSDCTVTQSSGGAVLDKDTCSLLLRRGRFEPARDAEGAATQGEFNDSIEWIRPAWADRPRQT